MSDNPSAEAPAPDLVARLRAHKADIWNWNGEAMTAWDSWREAIAKGDKGSWPRDAFESLIGCYGEDMGEAAATITRLTAEVERLRAALKWYANQFCEYDGAEEFGCGKLSEANCSGCKARAALKEPRTNASDFGLTLDTPATALKEPRT